MIRKAIRLSLPVLRSKAARHSLVLFVGNILTAGMGFASVLIIARHLSTDQFGVFSTAQALMTTIVGFTNLGIGTVLTRYASEYLLNDVKKAGSVLKVGFKVQAAIGIAILVGGILTSPILARFFGDESEFLLPVQLAILGGFGMSMSSFISSVFQAYQKFIILPGWSISVNVLKLIAVILLAIFGGLTSLSALAVYALVPILGFIVGLILLPKDFIKPVGSEDQKQSLRTMFDFGKWIAISYIINSISGRSDIFLLQRIKGNEEVGIYNAGFQLALVFPLILGAVSTVLLPKVSQTNSRESYMAFLKKAFIGAGFLVLSLIPIFILAPFLVSTIFSHKYIDSIYIFQLLLINYGLNFLLMPITLLYLPLNRTDIGALVSFLQLFVVIGTQLLLIPILGAAGASISLIISTIFAAIIYSLVLVNIMRRLPYE